MAAVMTFYRFVPLADPETLQARVHARAAALSLKGTVLLATEGINGTLSGARAHLADFAAWLRAQPPFAGLRIGYSSAAAGRAVFDRLKVRLRAEIVRLGQPGVSVHARSGEHVDAVRWNALLDDPAVVVIDARNGYEVAFGSFPGARNPGTRTFRQLPAYLARHLDPVEHPRVAMFCTGGVRCEKASAWMLGQGFECVYQLDGGILDYLATAAADDNRWRGECFVFDQRGSVGPAPGRGAFEVCCGDTGIRRSVPAA